MRARLAVKGRSRTKLMVAAMVATGIIFLPATPISCSSVVTTSRCEEHRNHSPNRRGYPDSFGRVADRARDSSQLGEMMDYLPPRVFNGEGREGDMLNLVFVAQQEDLQDAFRRAGWVKTDKWRLTFDGTCYGTESMTPGSRWRGFTCSEGCRIIRMPCRILTRSSRAGIIFESGKPDTQRMALLSGRAPLPTTWQLKSPSGAI